MKRYVSVYNRSHGIKKQLLIAFTIFAIILSALLIGGNLLHTYQAKASNVYEEVIYYKSLRVNEGDSLWSLADQYMGNGFEDRESYIEEVKRLNHLTDDTIDAGAYLMIPYTEIVSDF